MMGRNRMGKPTTIPLNHGTDPGRARRNPLRWGAGRGLPSYTISKDRHGWCRGQARSSEPHRDENPCRASAIVSANRIPGTSKRSTRCFAVASARQQHGGHAVRRRTADARDRRALDDQSKLLILDLKAHRRPRALVREEIWNACRGERAEGQSVLVMIRTSATSPVSPTAIHHRAGKERLWSGTSEQLHGRAGFCSIGIWGFELISVSFSTPVPTRNDECFSVMAGGPDTQVFPASGGPRTVDDG